MKKIRLLAIVLGGVILVLSYTILAQVIETKNAPIVQTVYKYKKFEKFDFEDLEIRGETGSPGELSIAPDYQRKFRNRLPYRKNFNAEIKRAVERIR